MKIGDKSIPERREQFTKALNTKSQVDRGWYEDRLVEFVKDQKMHPHMFSDNFLPILNQLVARNPDKWHKLAKVLNKKIGD